MVSVYLLIFCINEELITLGETIFRYAARNVVISRGA